MNSFNDFFHTKALVTSEVLSFRIRRLPPPHPLFMNNSWPGLS